MSFTFYDIPLWAVFPITVGVVMLSIEAGFKLGLWRRRRSEKDSDSPIGSVVGAMLGLLAFILAFTFGIASGRFDTRKQLLLNEVNAIGTAYLRCELVGEPHKTECQQLLRRYVDIRLEIHDAPAKLAESITESEAIQGTLWAHAVALARADMNSDIVALLVSSLNEVFDLHTSRVTVALQYRIPAAIWLALLTVTVFSMATVGYQFGLAGRNSVLIQIALAMVFASVVVLIADLDRAGQGALRTNQQPMIELQKHMQRTMP